LLLQKLPYITVGTALADIIGERLVHAVGESTYPALLEWPCVAYNPRARAKKAQAGAAASEIPVWETSGDVDGWEVSGGSEDDRDKRYHLRAIAKVVGCTPKECMLIDDMT
jgi:hypothetical protein